MMKGSAEKLLISKKIGHKDKWSFLLKEKKEADNL